MAVKSWLNHGRALWAESEKAWKWLRGLPEYKADYKAMKETPLIVEDSGSGRHTILTAPIPVHPLEKSLRRRWGFYPLPDPSKRKLPNEFFHYLDRTFCFDSDTAGVRHDEFNILRFMKTVGRRGNYTLVSKKKLPPLPKRIVFRIDPRLPVKPAIKYLDEFLREVQRAYKIQSRRPRPDWLHQKYQVYVLRGLNKSQKEILAALKVSLGTASVDPASFLDPSDSNRQRLSRIMKEAAKVSA